MKWGPGFQAMVYTIMKGTLMFTKTHVMRLLFGFMIFSCFELYAQFEQTLRIKANSGVPVMSDPLQSGVQYIITVSGEFSIWPEQIGNGIDAGYIYSVPQSRIANSQWPAEIYINTGTGDTLEGIRLPAWVGNNRTFPDNLYLRQMLPMYEFNLRKWTGFRIDGQPISNMGYRGDNHRYQFTVTGNDTPLTFAIIDSILEVPNENAIPSYDDNSGELTIQIEQVMPFNVNICSTSPILDKSTNKMKGIKVDVSVLVPDTNKVKGRKNILFDKNQVAIYENGRFICPDTIYCNKTAEAISVALVFDRTRSMIGPVSRADSTIRINTAVSTAKSFVNTLGNRDQCLLLSFSDETDILVDQTWTSNRSALQFEIDQYYQKLRGNSTALHRALISAISRTELIGEKVKAVVAITDGANNVEPLDEMEVINALPKTGDIPVFIIALGLDTVRDTRLENPTQIENDSLKVLDNIEGLKKMRKIAQASNGRVYYVTDSKILDSIYTEISKDIREEECCTIEYAVEDCSNNLSDTVRSVVIYYPYEGGVSAKATTYKTSCAKGLLGKRDDASGPYTKMFAVKYGDRTTTLSLTMKKSDKITIDLMDGAGKRMKSVYTGRLEKGAHTINIDTKSMKPGNYTAVVFVKGKKLSQHEITIQE